jgi:hypothetical protein
MRVKILFALGGVLVAASTAAAGPFAIGDVFASVGNGLVREFTPSGVLVQTLNTNISSEFTTGGVFASSGNFYVTTFFSGSFRHLPQEAPPAPISRVLAVMKNRLREA